MGHAETSGMRAYSTDLKKRLVRAVADGQPCEKPLAALESPSLR